MFQTVDVISFLAAVTRSIVLIISALSGPLCILLGARIYKTAVSEKSVADVSGMGFRMILKSSGPGLFLIAFGAVIVCYVVSSKASIDESVGRPEGAAEGAAMFSRGDANLGRRFLIRVADSDKECESKCKPAKCLLYSKSVNFWDGGGELSSESIKQASKIAAEGIKRAGDGGVLDPNERLMVLNVLTELEQATSEVR